MMTSNLLITGNVNIAPSNDLMHVFFTKDQCTIRFLSDSYQSNDFTGIELLEISDLDTHRTYHVATDSSFDAEVDTEEVPPPSYLFKSDIKYWWVYQEISFKLEDIPEWDTSTEISVRIKNKQNDDNVLMYDRLTHTYFVKGDDVNARMVYDSRYNNEVDVSICLTFVVYDRDLDFLSCPKCIKCSSPCITNIEFDKIVDAENSVRSDVELKWYDENHLSLKVECPDVIKPNEMVECKLFTYHDDAPYSIDHVYHLDMIDGYSPNLRIHVVDGVGKFYIQALHLLSGESMQFRINDGSYTSRLVKNLLVE